MEEQLYDLYLYSVPDWEPLMMVEGISNEDAQSIANQWWDADISNECTVCESGDDPYFDDVDVETVSIDYIRKLMEGEEL